MPPNLTINIGAVTTAVEWQREQFDIVVPRSYRPFISEGRADLHLSLHLGAPQLVLGEKRFDSSPIWQLHRSGNASAIKFFDAYPQLKRWLVLSNKSERADLYFAEPGGQFIDPFFGPTMELMMINFLARGHGAIIHACGIDYHGKGMLFAGESGAGKSTLANLWNQEAGAAVLSDDRTLVRKINGQLWMFGTPWHGEAKFGSPQGVKLEQIFFLHHSPQNSISQIPGADAVMKLLQCSFPPYWDAAGMEFTMSLFEKLAAGAPCNELSFRPDGSVIEMIKRYMV